VHLVFVLCHPWNKHFSLVPFNREWHYKQRFWGCCCSEDLSGNRTIYTLISMFIFISSIHVEIHEFISVAAIPAQHQRVYSIFSSFHFCDFFYKTEKSYIYTEFLILIDFLIYSLVCIQVFITVASFSLLLPTCYLSQKPFSLLSGPALLHQVAYFWVLCLSSVWFHTCCFPPWLCITALLSSLCFSTMPGPIPHPAQVLRSCSVLLRLYEHSPSSSQALGTQLLTIPPLCSLVLLNDLFCSLEYVYGIQNNVLICLFGYTCTWWSSYYN
jgi:hypothetical protein